MKNFDNILTFQNQRHSGNKYPNDICSLILFTLQSKKQRDIITKVNISKNIKKGSNENEYIFIHNEKQYPFSVFSDQELQKIDKNWLTSKKRVSKDLLRTLKLCCSMDLVNPRVAIGDSIFSYYTSLIIFEDKGIDKIIDYGRNIIMNKKDYYELFNFCQFNIVDKYDLYNIYFILKNTGCFEYIYEYLIFSKEILNELAQKEIFSFFNDKYDRNGLNKRNYLLFGDDAESLFCQAEDFFETMKYDKIIRELDDFTENPIKKTKHISYDKEKDRYILKEKSFGHFTFGLLSDFFKETEIKEQLLSEDRYHECHPHAIMVANSLTGDDRKHAYVVAGTFMENETDELSHSWVEVCHDNINNVIDFNHNLIMNKDKYYKLFGIKVISKTHIDKIIEIVDFVIDEAGFTFHPIEINFFGEEIMRDLKRNEKVFSKKQ